MALQNEHALETIYGLELAAFLFNEVSVFESVPFN